MDSPVSLRDLPATVVDQLGLAGRLTVPGPIAGGSLVGSPGAGAPAESPPRPFQSRPTDRLPARSTKAAAGIAGSRCRWWPRAIITFGMAWGPRCSTILARDPVEQVNLMGTSSGDRAVGAFRKMLFEVLTENPGSIEVETAYLEPYRQRLSSAFAHSGDVPRAARPVFLSRPVAPD